MKERLRLLYLIDTLDDPDRGPTAHLRRLVGGMDRAYFNPCIVVTGGISARVDVTEFGCPVVPLEMDGRGAIASRWRFRRMRQVVRRQPFDLVCALGYSSRVVALPEARAAGVPVCLASVQDMGLNLTPGQLVALQASNRTVTRFVTNAGASAARLVRQEHVARDTIDIIPGAIDLSSVPMRTEEDAIEAKHKFGFSVEQPLVVIDAPFDRRQDHPTFFAAAAHLLPHHPGARFVVIGESQGMELAELDREARRLGVRHATLFENDLSRRELWLQAADAAVLTSPFEGCSDTLLHCMAMGLPVVATDAGGNGELIVHGQTGYLVPPRDADAVAMRLHLLLAARDLAVDFAVAARERVRAEFSVGQEVRRFSDYYRSLAYCHCRGDVSPGPLS